MTLTKDGYLRLYRSLGLSIIPIRPRDKRPSLERWEGFQNERPSDAQLADWFADAALNVGVVCGEVSGGLIVLDFDSDEGYAQYWDGRDPSEKTFTVKTGRGFQVWMRDPLLDRAVTKLDFRPFMELELRANAHYIVAPPSVHPSGAVYSVLGVHEILERPGLVSSVENRLRELGYQGAVRKWPRLRDLTQGVPAGRRNAAAFVWSRYLLNTLRMEPADALLALQIWNQRNTPPLYDDELESVLKSALKYPKQKPLTPFKEVL